MRKFCPRRRLGRRPWRFRSATICRLVRGGVGVLLVANPGPGE